MAQNSKMPKIQISAVGGKKSYQPLKHDVYATHRVGKIVPYMCRFMDAGTKTKVDLETLEYNAPMVGPTVGDVKFKQWHYFVGLDKLLPNFSEMFAKNPDILGNGEMWTKSKVPQISLRYLSMLSLIGAHCTCYYSVSQQPFSSNYLTHVVDYHGPFLGDANSHCFLIKVGSLHQFDYANFITLFNAAIGVNNEWRFYGETGSLSTEQIKRSLFFKGSSMPYTECPGIGVNLNFLDLNKDFGLTEQNPYLGFIPLSNPSYESLFDWINAEGEPVYTDVHETRSTHGLDVSPVSPDTPDAKITRKFILIDSTTSTRVEFNLHLCFRLSDFGRAVRDIIHASGNQINFISDKKVSFLPYLSIYLAYYHCQSLMMYQNWKMTYAYKILKKYDNDNFYLMDAQFLSAFTDNYNNFTRFIGRELGSMWAICPQDFVSIHQRDPIIAPQVYADLDRFTTNSNAAVSGQGGQGEPIQNNDPSRTESGALTNYTPYINNVNHDVYVAELLKRLTLRMNVNTLEGRKTREFCELNGYGEWLDLQKADFVDYGELDITMRPVVSQSDTSTTSGKGADLGQYGGRGFGSGRSKGKTYVNKVPGYYIVLTTVYVDAGYCQQIDPYNFQIDVDDFYRRDFDSLGFEINEKNLICGEAIYCDKSDYGKSDEGFGYAPRDLKYKQMGNILLGGFSTGVNSPVYDTYHLERLLPIGHQNIVSMHDINGGEDTNNYKTFMLSEKFKYSDLPKCGNVWRFLGRYPWLGQFDRIFKLQPDEVNRVQGLYNLSEYGANLVEVMDKLYTFFTTTPENYTILNTMYVDTWQDKVPASRSFNTLSEIFEGGASKTIKKE